MDPPPDLVVRHRPRLPLDLRASLRPLRRGPHDPTAAVRNGTVWRATRTPSGPVTMRLEHRDGEVRSELWGPGASCAADRLGALLGDEDRLEGWRPEAHPLVSELARRSPGLRMVSTGAVWEATAGAVVEQKVTSAEAHRSWRSITAAWGEPAPGPAGLRLPPDPATVARLPYFAFHRHGVERRRADVLRGLAARVNRLEEAARLPASARRPRLEAFPGVGPWTSATVAQVAWGDADAVPVGDYHIPGIVVFALTGLRGGDDDGMLELLEPFRPHRARAARLIVGAGLGPEARAPRARLRDIRAV